MPKKDSIIRYGVVKEVLKDGFRVALYQTQPDSQGNMKIVFSADGSPELVVTPEGDAAEMKCVLSGKMKQYKIRIIPGDTVKVEISPYDLTRGRIVYRGKLETTV